MNSITKGILTAVKDAVVIVCVIAVALICLWAWIHIDNSSSNSVVTPAKATSGNTQDNAFYARAASIVSRCADASPQPKGCSADMKWVLSAQPPSEVAAQEFAKKKALAKERAMQAAKVAAAKASKEAAACRLNLQCWASNPDNEADAETLCKVGINQVAEHAVKWTDGLLTPMFDSFAWADQTNGSITYVGDHVMLQNGFGAMDVMTYLCTYDPGTKTLTEIQMAAGHRSNDGVVASAMLSNNLLSAPITLPSE